MLAFTLYFRIRLFKSLSQFVSLTIRRYLHFYTAGITCFPNTKTRKSNFNLICFITQRNDLVALYDNWWQVAYASHVSKDYRK